MKRRSDQSSKPDAGQNALRIVMPPDVKVIRNIGIIGNEGSPAAAGGQPICPPGGKYAFQKESD